MSIRYYLKHYLKFAIAIAIASSIQPQIWAQTKSEITAQNIDMGDRLSSPWENAVLSRTLESATTVNHLEFSPDGEVLAAVGAGQITLWSIERGEIQRILPSHYATELGWEIAPTAIAFSPDSNFLVTATWSQGLLTPDRSLVVWDVATGKEVLSLNESSGCRQALFDVTGTILYAACDLGVTAWSFPEGKKLFSLDTGYPIETMALHPQGKVMAMVDANTSGGQQGEKSNQIQLWELDGDSSASINTLDGHVNDIAKIEFTADGKKLVSSSYDGKINVWNWQQGTIDRRTNNLYSKNGLFSLSADGRSIAGDFHSSTITSLVTGLPIRNVMLTPSKPKPQLVAFSPSGRMIVRMNNSQQPPRSQIDLWQSDVADLDSPKAIDENYLSIPIAEYWGNGKTQTGQPDRELPSSIGKDPQEIALSALGLTEIMESEREEVQINYPEEDLAVVTIVQTNLLDDSVKSKRYRVKFAPYGDQEQALWQVVSAGQQFQCYTGRGHQDWSKDLCQ